MPDQAPFDLTGAPRPWLGRRLWNRAATWLYRRRHPFSRAELLRLLVGRD